VLGKLPLKSNKIRILNILLVIVNLIISYNLEYCNIYFLDTMGVCFVCDTKLYGERTRVCSSITKHSKVTYPEKIVELLGDDFVVIVTPADHMCKRCNSSLTFIDKTENDLKLVKRAILSFIKKKYGLLPPDHVVEDINVRIKLN